MADFKSPEMRAVLQFERFHSRLYQKIAPGVRQENANDDQYCGGYKTPVLRVGDSYWAYPNTILSDATKVPTTI